MVSNWQVRIVPLSATLPKSGAALESAMNPNWSRDRPAEAAAKVDAGPSTQSQVAPDLSSMPELSRSFLRRRLDQNLSDLDSLRHRLAHMSPDAHTAAPPAAAHAQPAARDSASVASADSFPGNVHGWEDHARAMDSPRSERSDAGAHSATAGSMHGSHSRHRGDMHENTSSCNHTEQDDGRHTPSLSCISSLSSSAVSSPRRQSAPPEIGPGISMGRREAGQGEGLGHIEVNPFFRAGPVQRSPATFNSDPAAANGAHVVPGQHPQVAAAMPVRLPRDASFEEIHRRAQELLSMRPLYRPDITGAVSSPSHSVGLTVQDGPVPAQSTFMPADELRQRMAAVVADGPDLSGSAQPSIPRSHMQRHAVGQRLR